MDVLHQVVYSSKAARQMSPKDLAGILKVARLKNHAAKITGILLYRSGYFLQVLEGPKDRLRSLLDKLNGDSRHTDVRILLDAHILVRAFGAWSMAFQDVTGLDPAALPDYSRFLKNGFGSVECTRYPQKVLKMALAFRDTDLERFQILTENAPLLIHSNISKR